MNAKDIREIITYLKATPAVTLTGPGGGYELLEKLALTAEQPQPNDLLDKVIRLLEEWVANDDGDFDETLQKIKELRK